MSLPSTGARVARARARDAAHALSRWPAVLAFAVLTFATSAAVAAAERTPDPYGLSRFGSAAAKSSIARDASAFGAYPPAAPLSPEHTSFPSAAAPRVPTYPPAKGSPVPTPPLPSCGVFLDCSFEDGGIGWIGADVTTPLLPLGIYGGGVSSGFGLFSSAPTDGAAAVLTGFDGDGPGVIALAQDVILSPGASRLTFDYRAGWDMFNFTGSTQARTFSVQIQPSGGGFPLQATTVLTAEPGTVTLDTGPLVGSVDISAFAGQSVRVMWLWYVPENFTGPGMFQLDHIGVVEDHCLAIGNCSFELGALTNWTVSDLSNPLIPAAVFASGAPLYGLNCMPTDGGFAFGHGWDGNGPGDIRLFQDVVLPAATSGIAFDYRAYWNLFGTLPRRFTFEVQPSGGGAPLQSQLILTAAANTSTLDTGPLTGLVDLHAFAGQAVRLVFDWNVPENFSGPADFQLDNIRLSQGTCASVDNCSFESGSFPAWTTSDMVTPHIPIHVGAAGEPSSFGFFTSTPTDGGYALLTGFDGDGPNSISAYQDVTLPLWADLLRFDYRAGWDLITYGGGTMPRTCELVIEPFGGGTALASDVVMVARPQTQTWDTGPLSRTFPLTAFAGQQVRIVFRWTIPEYFTGPALFQLDRVMLDNSMLAVGPGGSPGRALDLRPALPNPSRETATFALTLSHPGDVDLEIVDVRGARVWSERHSGMPAGEHRLTWNGARAEGGTAPAGVYYARVRTKLGATSRMFVRVR